MLTSLERTVDTEQTYVFVAPSEGTVHDVYVAEISAHTLSALLDLRRPYADDVFTRRFSVDVRRPEEYASVLHSVMAQWAETAARLSQLAVTVVAGRKSCGTMSANEGAPYGRRTRKQPPARCALYRIAKPRKTPTANRKHLLGVTAHVAEAVGRK